MVFTTYAVLPSAGTLMASFIGWYIFGAGRRIAEAMFSSAAVA
ncbi:MAG: hypothetical protein ABI878_11110 [Acidobacteriota bacterium]